MSIIAFSIIEKMSFMWTFWIASLGRKRKFFLKFNIQIFLAYMLGPSVGLNYSLRTEIIKETTNFRFPSGSNVASFWRKLKRNWFPSICKHPNNKYRTLIEMGLNLFSVVISLISLCYHENKCKTKRILFTPIALCYCCLASFQYFCLPSDVVIAIFIRNSSFVYLLFSLCVRQRNHNRRKEIRSTTSGTVFLVVCSYDLPHIETRSKFLYIQKKKNGPQNRKKERREKNS